MPQLIRFLICHALIGMALAVVFVAALVGLDIAGLGTLMWNSSSGIMAALALTPALGITFGSAQMGFAVMLLPRDETR